MARVPAEVKHPRYSDCHDVNLCPVSGDHEHGAEWKSGDNKTPDPAGKDKIENCLCSNRTNLDLLSCLFQMELVAWTTRRQLAIHRFTEQPEEENVWGWGLFMSGVIPSTQDTCRQRMFVGLDEKIFWLFRCFLMLFWATQILRTLLNKSWGGGLYGIGMRFHPFPFHFSQLVRVFFVEKN